MKKYLSSFISHHSSKKGFTLIELLVVMAIIGILATVASVNFIGVRERSRDAQRKADLAQIQSALEFYRADVGTYPAALPTCGQPITNGSTIIYMKKSPCDPTSKSKYQYTPNAVTNTYTLFACLENKQDKDGIASPNGTCSSGKYYLVQNP